MDYMKYSPYLCIGAVLAVIFVLWVFWGGKNDQFVGIDPIKPETMEQYPDRVNPWNKRETDNPSNPETTVTEQVIEPERSLEPESRQICEGNQDKTSFLEDTSVPQEEVEVEVVAPVCAVEPIKVTRRGGRFISRGERVCCQTMERIYGLPFISIRPDWLKNPETGYNLELDCYNDDLKLAVEYNGIQHYEWPNFTNQTYDQFMSQVRRDQFKSKVCNENGVYLITVPHKVNYSDIPKYIMSQLPETVRKRLQEEKRF